MSGALIEAHILLWFSNASTMFPVSTCLILLFVCRYTSWLMLQLCTAPKTA